MATYGSDFCIRCGIAPTQLHPFRLRGEPGAKHSDFLWIHWVHDELFVRPHVAADLSASAIGGVEIIPVLRDKSDVPLQSIVQLRIEGSLASGAVITEGLQRVTCRPENEESHVQLPTEASRVPPGAPHCGRHKHHPPQRLRVRAGSLAGAPDVLRSAEWFGSGGKAFRVILVSARLVQLAKARKWRGVRWHAVELVA